MCQCKEQNYATENKKNRWSEIESLFLEITISNLPSFYPYPPTVKPQYNEREEEEEEYFIYPRLSHQAYL